VKLRRGAAYSPVEMVELRDIGLDHRVGNPEPGDQVFMQSA